jgi:hypothetical protein
LQGDKTFVSATEGFLNALLKYTGLYWGVCLNTKDSSTSGKYARSVSFRNILYINTLETNTLEAYSHYINTD